jgi:hypothetical protein
MSLHETHLIETITCLLVFITISVIVMGIIRLRLDYEEMYEITRDFVNYKELFLDLTMDLGWWNKTDPRRYFYVSKDLANVLQMPPCGAAVTRLQVAEFLVRYVQANELLDVDRYVYLTDDPLYNLLPEAEERMPLAYVVLEIQNRHLL